MDNPRSRARRWIFLSIATLAMLLLIAGLPYVELTPGVPFAQIIQFLIKELGLGRGMMSYGMGTEGSSLLLDIYRTLFYIALALFPVAVVLVMIDPKLRKRVLRSTLSVLLISILLALFMRNELTQSEEALIEPAEGMPAQETWPLGEAYAPDTLAPEAISPWIERGLTLAIALGVAAILVVIIVHARRNRLEPESALDDIAFKARNALEEIKKGSDLRNVVLRCYAEMIHVVREQRGLYRERTVTAREFTDYLIHNAKLPHGPVDRLTNLFERARYSDRPTTPEDEAEAVASLRAIVQACEALA